MGINPKRILMYTAIVLTPESQHKLSMNFKSLVPVNWVMYCHHMTINMNDFASGPLRDSSFVIGSPVELTVINYAYDNLVIAAGVDTLVPSTNKIKHITIAVNKNAGGKPFLSNNLTNWHPISPINLKGIISEVK